MSVLQRKFAALKPPDLRIGAVCGEARLELVEHRDGRSQNVGADGRVSHVDADGRAHGWRDEMRHRYAAA